MRTALATNQKYFICKQSTSTIKKMDFGKLMKIFLTLVVLSTFVSIRDNSMPVEIFVKIYTKRPPKEIPTEEWTFAQRKIEKYFSD